MQFRNPPTYCLEEPRTQTWPLHLIEMQITIVNHYIWLKSDDVHFGDPPTYWGTTNRWWKPPQVILLTLSSGNMWKHYHLEKCENTIIWKNVKTSSSEKCENIIIWKIRKQQHLIFLKTSSWNIGKHCHLKNKKAVSSRKIGQHNHLEKCESNIT